MKKIALFGGTFNPVHNGHISIIKKADDIFCFDKIIIMPSKIPPHKEANELANEYDRFNMLKLVFSDEKYIVSDYEFLNSGKSYTWITVEYLRNKYPDDELYLIIGSDMFLTFTQWVNYKYLIKECKLITTARNENEYQILLNQSEALKKDGAFSYIMNVTPFVVSSTEIRNNLHNGKSVDGLIPDSVKKYIENNRIYKNRE